MNNITEKTFLNDVKNHHIEIIKDEKNYRHIIMTSGSFNMRYEIITWPEYLCLCGDMGCFVFSRIDDMFNFFRSNSNELTINPSYWHEKLQSEDTINGAKEYDSEKFEKTIKEYFNDYIYDYPDIDKEKLWEEIEKDVLYYASDGEYQAHRAAIDFKYLDFEFHDFWEQDLKSYTGRYIWCLYAIVYAIQQYDKSLKK
jgi:hypothetical protein